MMDAPQPPERLPARALDPDARERVVEVLTRHYAEDRISSDDLEVRLERVYHAATPAELEAVIADLPAALPVDTTAPVPAGSRGAERISALMSAQEQRLTGVVPRDVQVRARLGYVELDLTRATFEPGLTVIDARAFMGYVQIRLPAGVRVECRGRAVAGFFSLKGGSASEEDSPRVVRITGRAAFGFAECFVAGHTRPRLRDGT